MSTASEVEVGTSRSKDPDSKRLPFLTALFGMLTALLTVVSAGLGLWANSTKNERDDIQATAEERGQEVADLEAEKAGLEDTIEGLEADVVRLKDELARAGGAPSDDDNIRRQTGDSPLVIPFRTSVDLDSEAPNWGVDTDAGRDFDIWDFGGAPHLRRIFTTSTITEIAVVATTPTRQDCVDSTLYAGNLTTEQTRQGTEMCIQTSEGRHAYVKIAALDLQAGTISFDITVWET